MEFVKEQAKKHVMFIINQQKEQQQSFIEQIKSQDLTFRMASTMPSFTETNKENRRSNGSTL